MEQLTPPCGAATQQSEPPSLGPDGTGGISFGPMEYETRRVVFDARPDGGAESAAAQQRPKVARMNTLGRARVQRIFDAVDADEVTAAPAPLEEGQRPSSMTFAQLDMGATQPGTNFTGENPMSAAL